MNHSMISASVTMTALQQKLDVLSHNIANLDTQGYKRKEASFLDVLTAVKEQPDDFMLDGRRTPNGVTEAWGARLGQIQIDLTQGSLKSTDQPLDIAIEGKAMIEIADPQFDATGNPVLDAAGNPIVGRLFTRGGSFKLAPIPGDDQNARLTTADGHLVRDKYTGEPILIPKDNRVVIDAVGNVVVYNDQDSNDFPVVMGSLPLVLVKKPQLLFGVGDNFYTIPADEANPNQIVQAIDLNGPQTVETQNIQVRQGFLEQSNVRLADEMTEIINIQRAFQLNARALASADQMMNLANNLRG